MNSGFNLVQAAIILMLHHYSWSLQLALEQTGCLVNMHPSHALQLLWAGIGHTESTCGTCKIIAASNWLFWISVPIKWVMRACDTHVLCAQSRWWIALCTILQGVLNQLHERWVWLWMRIISWPMITILIWWDWNKFGRWEEKSALELVCKKILKLKNGELS